MNNKVKFLEIVLADLVSERDTLELDLNNILNSTQFKNSKLQKKEFNIILGEIVEINNKIKTLSEYLTQLTPLPEERVGEPENA
jgi:hypothetical protein